VVSRRFSFSFLLQLVDNIGKLFFLRAPGTARSAMPGASFLVVRSEG
jgi:hypothetical protein